MKATAITPNNFTKVCVASGILPDSALTEELDDDTQEFVAFESLGQQLSGEFYARDADGEWEQI